MCCSRQSRYHERSLIASSLLVLALTLRAESLQKGPEYKKNQSESSIDNVGKMIASLKGSAIVGPFGGGEPYRFEGRPDIGYMLMDAAADNFQVHGVLKESSEGPQTAGEQLLYLDAISFLFGGGEIVVKPGKTDSIQVFVDGVRLGGAKHEDAKMYRWLRTSSGTVHLSLQAYVEKLWDASEDYDRGSGPERVGHSSHKPVQQGGWQRALPVFGNSLESGPHRTAPGDSGGDLSDGGWGPEQRAA
eukprot:jgi/Botrbrau1/5987/Bobra.104_1s0018.1